MSRAASNKQEQKVSASLIKGRFLAYFGEHCGDYVCYGKA
jgi:hypothetical protein